MARKIRRDDDLAADRTPSTTRELAPEDVLRFLSQDGALQPGVTAPMSDSEALAALRLMMLSRAIDDRAIKLNRGGSIGIYSPVHGQEAAVVGSCWALDPKRDWLVPAYREQPALVRHGLPLSNLFGGYLGKVVATRVPDGVKLLPSQVSIATQLSHAVGLAWGLRLQHIEAAVMVYCGEGATSEGDFHEACNLAGVMNAPVVFLVQNNGWAISTPLNRQTAAKTLASRAAGYGFPGVVADGNDFFAVYAAAREGVERALSGAGPTLIEARTFRMGFHNTTDNPREYRDPAEEEAARAKDPIDRLQHYLAARGAFDDLTADRWHAEISAEIDTAVQTALGLPSPGLDDVFDNVYATPPPRMVSEREAMRKLGAPPDR